MAPTNKRIDPAIQALMDQLNAGGTRGPVQYLKDGSVTIKLMLPPGRKTHPDLNKGEKPFYELFQNRFTDGKDYTYALIAGVIIEADDDSIVNREQVRYIKVTKGIVLEILSNMGRWKTLFNEGEGNVYIINKGKKGGKVNYTTAPDMETFDASGLEWPEISIEEAAEEQAQSSRDRQDKAESLD